MISKNKIKFLRSLSLKKNRLKYKQVILEGYRLIEEAINAKVDIDYLVLTKKENKKIQQRKIFSGINLEIISNEDMKKISDIKNSQGILALCNIDKYNNNILENIKNENIVILDGIQDFGNLGTIFRTCIWFGIKSVILTSNSIDPYNSKCIRSGMGAHFHLKNIIQQNTNKVLMYLNSKNYKIIVGDLDGENIINLNIKGKWALILGSEAHGISQCFDQFKKVTIQKFGEIESLNVSTACGILLNELTTN